MNFCEETVKLNGSIPMIGHAVYMDTKIQFSSLLVLNQPMGEAIAFLGTNTGELLQVRLLPSGHAFRAEPYQLIMIDHRQPILSDMLMDESQTHLFVASARKVKNSVTIEKLSMKNFLKKSVKLHVSALSHVQMR